MIWATAGDTIQAEEHAIKNWGYFKIYIDLINFIEYIQIEV